MMFKEPSIKILISILMIIGYKMSEKEYIFEKIDLTMAKLLNEKKISHGLDKGRNNVRI